MVCIEHFNPDKLKLRLSTKKLASGNFQVKFQVSDAEVQCFYGYVLAEPGTTLKHVVSSIKRKISNKGTLDSSSRVHLYSMNQIRNSKDTILIFND